MIAAAAFALSAALGTAAPAQELSTGPARRPISLDEAYSLALRRSETIAQDAEAYRQALANVDMLRADILPHLTLSGTETIQENPRTGIALIDKTSYPAAQLTVTQPIFSGFREFLAFKAGKKQAEAALLTQQRAESLLFRDVAQAYLNLNQAQREIDIRQDVIDATRKQVEQLRHWVDIGRSRESELLAARSQLASAQAQVEITLSAEAVDQEVLRFLTGLGADVQTQDALRQGLQPLDPYLARAQNRDDVLAAERSLEYAQLSTSITARQRWGSVGLTANYFMVQPGFSENIHYNGVVSASLPLFDSGVISAQVRQARAQERSSAQALSLARRGAERDVRSAYRNLQWALSAVSGLSNAADLAAENVKAQMQDFRRNLVTNLDVLTSLNTLQAARIQLNAARQQAAYAEAQLEVAAGGPARKS